ncbi:MAG: signal peptidase I [Anaerolineales bacterium]
MNNIQSGGKIWLIIVGKSMLPYLIDGDKVLIQGEDFENLKCGDIITYRINNEYFTHRIIKKLDTTLLTKGDHLYLPDNYIDINSIIGKVIAIDKKNKLIDLNQKKYRIINRCIGNLQKIVGILNLYISSKFVSALGQKATSMIFKISNLFIYLVERILICG